MCYNRSFCNNVDIVESDYAGFRATGYLSTLLLLGRLLIYVMLSSVGCLDLRLKR